jgi:hypothetical protein
MVKFLPGQDFQFASGYSSRFVGTVRVCEEYGKKEDEGKHRFVAERYDELCFGPRQNTELIGKDL